MLDGSPVLVAQALNALFGIAALALVALGLAVVLGLLGVGAENSANLYSCMGYFANNPSDAAKAFKAEYMAKYGEKAPQLATIGADCYSALNLAKALFDKAGAADPKKLAAASEGLTFTSASGPVTMHGRQVDKDMYLAECKGAGFEVIKTIKAVKSGTACKA